MRFIVHLLGKLLGFIGLVLLFPFMLVLYPLLGGMIWLLEEYERFKNKLTH